MKVQFIMISAAAVAMGFCALIAGGVMVWWLMSRPEARLAYATDAGAQTLLTGNQPPHPGLEAEAGDAQPRAAETGPAVERGSRSVIVNGQRLSQSCLAGLDRLCGYSVVDGSYWYDRFTGAWGLQGGPCAGIIPAGMNIGGLLRADASSGTTGVFVNGRQLHYQDVMALQTFMPVQRGRYWMDAQGNFGYEGGPRLGNIAQLARATQAAQAAGSWSSRDGNRSLVSDGNGFIGFTSRGLDGKTTSVYVQH